MFSQTHINISSQRTCKYNFHKINELQQLHCAKARGVYKGRKPSIDKSKVLEVKAQGMGASVIAKELGIGRASVYRCLA